MTNLKKLSKELVLAIDWAAAEYKYLEELKEELKQVETEKDIKKELKELRKAAKILHYVAKAERRAYEFEERVGRELVELLPELQQEGISADLILGFRDLATELGVEHHQLVKLASFYEGTLEKELDKARVEALLEAKGRSEHSQQVHQAFLELVHHFSSQVADAERWITGLEATLKKAKALLEKIPKGGKKHLQDEGRKLLIKNGFPIKKYPQETEFMCQHYSDLRKIVDAAGKRNGLFFEAGGIIQPFPMLAGWKLIDERHWQGIVDITVAVSEEAHRQLGIFYQPENIQTILKYIFSEFKTTGLMNTSYWPSLVISLWSIFKKNIKIIFPDIYYASSNSPFHTLNRAGFFTVQHWQDTILELKRLASSTENSQLAVAFVKGIPILIRAEIVNIQNWQRFMPSLIELYEKYPEEVLTFSLNELAKARQITPKTFPLIIRVLPEFFKITGNQFRMGCQIISFLAMTTPINEEVYILLAKALLRVVKEVKNLSENSIGSCVSVMLEIFKNGQITEENEKRLAKYLSDIASYSEGVEERTYHQLSFLTPLFKHFGIGLFELLIFPTLKRQSVASFLCFQDYHLISGAIQTEEDINLLVKILSKRKFKAHDFFQHILIPGVQTKVIASPISQEKDYLLPFMNGCTVDLLEIYIEYKRLLASDHPEKMKHIDQLFKDLKKIKEDIFSGVLSKEYEPMILLGVLYGIFSPELTVPRESYQQAYDKRKDRQTDIPLAIQKLSPEEVSISAGGYALKEGEIVNDEAWKYLIEIVAEVNSKGAEKVVPELLGLELLEAFFTKRLAKERKEYLRKIYAYWRQLGNGLPEFNADHATLMKYKEFVGDRLKNDLIVSLVDAAYTKQQKKFIDLNARFEKPKNFTGLAKQLFGLWSSQRADKEERIRAILQQNGLRAEKLEWQVQKWQDIAQWLEQKAAGTISKDLISSIFAMLIGEDYGKMQKEMDKFEHSHQATGKGGKKFIFMLSKRKVHSVAMFNMGVCVAPDDQLWNSPNFWQLIIWDEDFHAHGGIIYRTIEEQGKRYLILSIQPAGSILNEVSPVHLYDQLIAFSEKMRKKLGYDQILIPTSGSIHSNRGSIQAIISQRNYPKKELLHKYDFSYSPYHYEYQDFFRVSL